MTIVDFLLARISEDESWARLSFAAAEALRSQQMLDLAE